MTCNSNPCGSRGIAVCKVPADRLSLPVASLSRSLCACDIHYTCARAAPASHSQPERQPSLPETSDELLEQIKKYRMLEWRELWITEKALVM